MIKNKRSLIVAVFALLASSLIASASLAVYSYSGTTTTTGGGKSLSTSQTGTMVIDLDTMAATYVGQFSTGSGKTIKNWWMSAPLSDAISTQILGPNGASYTLLAVGGNPGSRYTGSVAHFENAFGLNSRLTIRNKGITETAILPKTLSSPGFVISEDNTYDYFTQSAGTYTFNSAATLAYNNLNKSFSTAVTELENAYKARKFTQWSSSNLIGMPTPTPAPSPTLSSQSIVSTLAGSGNASFLNGVGSNASFKYPSGVAVDKSGNVYVADSGNNRIRKITANGTVTTLAGSGTAGFADGTGVNASFNFPGGVAVDASGNVYVADNGNNRIRKITANGTVTTLAGSGTAGSADGVGLNASFWIPCEISIDKNGYLYVADNCSQKIRKISPLGVVSTLTEIGGAFPSGVAVDSAGNVYFADQNYNKIYYFTINGALGTLAGGNGGGWLGAGSADGIANSASFYSPQQVAVDGSGNIYVADSGNNKIRKIQNGAVMTFAGAGAQGSANGPSYSATFSGPSGIAIDGAGNIYVADTANHKIRKIIIPK
jgi:sugar lactone lactonase YvrE